MTISAPGHDSDHLAATGDPSEHDLGELATYAKVLVVEALVLIALFTFSRLFG
jgi:hypothetical protein